MLKSLRNRFKFLSALRAKAKLWRLKSRQLISSRNYWKNRAMYLTAEVDVLNAKIAILKRQIGD